MLLIAHTTNSSILLQEMMYARANFLTHTVVLRKSFFVIKSSETSVSILYHCLTLSNSSDESTLVQLPATA